MADYQFTVKGLFTLAEEYERLASQAARQIERFGETPERECEEFKALAQRCRNKAYMLLGVTTIDTNQRHMGEVMADF